MLRWFCYLPLHSRFAFTTSPTCHLIFIPHANCFRPSKPRGLYYETQPDGIPTWKLETAIRQAKLKADVEPVVFERLVAFTYRFTGEQLWIARIYSSLFWLIGGIFLFMLVRDLVSFEGAIFSTAYYLFFPYAIIASRSFQPDPLMVMLTLSFWWMFARWMTLTSSPSPNGRGNWGEGSASRGTFGRARDIRKVFRRLFCDRRGAWLGISRVLHCANCCVMFRCG